MAILYCLANASNPSDIIDKDSISSSFLYPVTNIYSHVLKLFPFTDSRVLYIFLNTGS